MAIKFRITIEEGFGVIQKLLAAGFGIEIGNFASVALRAIET